MKDKLKIAILGYIVRGPLGGLVWHHFQYVYGFHLLGHDVMFIEDSDDYDACYNPENNSMTSDPSYGLSFIHSMFSGYGLDEKWAYFDFHTNRWFGRTSQQANSFLNEADVMINLSGVNPLRDWVMNIPVKIMIDTDPVFTQIKNLQDSSFREVTRIHSHFFTYGENFGKEGCSIPDDGFKWVSTRQPVVLDLWKSKGTYKDGKWTTILQWDSYASKEWKGISYEMKSRSFQPFLELPSLVKEIFELALGSNTAPAHQLISLGWLIADPLEVTKTPYTYRNYIQNSKGEWSVAKHGYVISNSGWFSDRSAVYLACGKPVVVQDTGFSAMIPTGEGLFGFKSLQDLFAVFEMIRSDYFWHCSRAQSICSEFFDHRKVLGNLLDLN